jgi:predicted Zn-dependent protease with MMP-like domain
VYATNVTCAHSVTRGILLTRVAGVHGTLGDVMSMAADEFERLVIDELDALPDDMVDGIENVAFLVEDRPADGSLSLLGEYDGIALTRRDRYGFGEMPDRIIVYREPLLSICSNESELRDQVHVTLVHEIAHYFGIDDAELHELGWA